jgi:hypothetical protein
VFVSANNGTLYARTPCPLMNVSSLAWDATTRTLFAAGGSGVAMTTDAGAHWTSLPSPGTVTSLVALPAGAVLAGTAQRGVLRWNSSAKGWWDVAQGAGVTSALTMTCSATTLLVGGTTGALVRVDLSAPVAAVGPAALDLGSIPVNQARSATFAITNLGAGALEWRIENVPSYVTVTPQTGRGNGAVIVRVEGDSLSKGPYQSLLKVVTNGGDQAVTLRFSIAAAASVRIALTVGKLAATVGGRTVTLDAAPYIDKASGRTMVPIRAIVEALGGSVTWKTASRSIMIQLGTTSIVLRIGAMSATVDGVAKPLTVPATILGGRTMVPVRFVAENLGCVVGWNALARTVTITRQG